MDPRRKIFSRWNINTTFKEFQHELSYMYENSPYLINLYTCGRCLSPLYVGRNDILSLIEQDPEKYLYLNEIIVCSTCMKKVSREKTYLPLTARRAYDSRASIQYEKPDTSFRYIYNLKHDYYMRIDVFTVDFHLSEIIFRSKSPCNDPFFFLDNTLFDIVYITLFENKN